MSCELRDWCMPGIDVDGWTATGRADRVTTLCLLASVHSLNRVDITSGYRHARSDYKFHDSRGKSV